MDNNSKMTKSGGGICRALNPLEDQDLPDKLPNPEALTFSGGASGSYDGSRPMTVQIPQKLPNPQALTIIGSAGNDTYDGNVAKTISAEAIGATGTAIRQLTASDDLLRLPPGTYFLDGTVPANKNYPKSIEGIWRHLTVSVFGVAGAVLTGGNGYSFIMIYDAYDAIYLGGKRWDQTATWVKLQGTNA